MGFLLSSLDNPPSTQTLEPPVSSIRGIGASPKSSLLVEDDNALSDFLKRCLKAEGYSVRTASSAEEGLRLYRDFRPFNVVLINYCVPHREGQIIDPLAPQENGVELARAIRNIDSTQAILFAAFAFSNPAEVPRPTAVMDIPLLLDCTASRIRGLLERVEIDLAIKSLTPADLLRLRTIAALLVRGIGRAARGRDWQDLLNEAQCRTLIGAGDTQNGRHWNRKVSFVMHLAGAMKSIANLWKRQFREKETYLISELVTCDQEGEESSPVDNLPSDSVPADRRLIEEGTAAEAFALFNSDETEALVLRRITDGLGKNEIKRACGLNEKQYAATIRRLRHKLLTQRTKGSQ
ncbi:MAG TPA: response regulator [Candidatus Sulfotelmatobacter sp.]|nr:response regulator [Candidatus Sulfotelmatobacter sp.]